MIQLFSVAGEIFIDKDGLRVFHLRGVVNGRPARQMVKIKPTSEAVAKMLVDAQTDEFWVTPAGASVIVSTRVAT